MWRQGTPGGLRGSTGWGTTTSRRGGPGTGTRLTVRPIVAARRLHAAGWSDGGTGRTVRAGTRRTVHTRHSGGASGTVRTRSRRAVRTWRYGGASRTVRTGCVPGCRLGTRAGAGWAAGATAPGTRDRCVTRDGPGPAGRRGAGGAPSRCGGTGTRRGSATGVRVVATVARGPGSTRSGRAVRARLGRWASSTGRVRGGRSVRAGPSRRTAAPAGGVRRGCCSAPVTVGPLPGCRRIGQGLFSRGSRRVRLDDPTTGRCLRARVNRRPRGPAAGGALGGRIGHGQPTGRVVGELTRAGGRRRTAPCGGRGAATAVDHRQAGVGVRQAAGLTQPVGGPLRAVRPGFAAGRRTSLRIVGDGPATTGAVGRADGGRGAAVTAGGLGHRWRVARAGHRRPVGLRGTAAATGCRTGALGGPAAGGLWCPGVDRAWVTPGGTRVTVDGGVGPQAVRDRRHSASRGAVEPGRAGGDG